MVELYQQISNAETVEELKSLYFATYLKKKAALERFSEIRKAIQALEEEQQVLKPEIEHFWDNEAELIKQRIGELVLADQVDKE